MSALETRAISLTAEQWRHLEMLAEDALKSSALEYELCVEANDNASAQYAKADFDFDTAILTSIRSAGA